MHQAKQWVLIFIKGAAMGAADIVPGVSGGTVAFITGIYERLLHALAAFSLSLFSLLRREGVAAVWQKVDGSFLLVLATGIAGSALTLAKLISWLLVTYPEPLWALFFGLILASAWLLTLELIEPMGHLEKNRLFLLFYFTAGAIFAYFLTIVVPMEVEPTFLTLFGAGSIAICAMLLPGISGSFMLLLMGLYGPVLAAVKSLDLLVLLQFMSGCLVGLLSFAKLLNWLFKHYKIEVMALLVGIMFGSLNKVWPWKQTVESRINSHGETVPLVQNNVLPWDYFSLTGQDPRLGTVMLAMLGGLVGVLILQKWFHSRNE